MNPKHHNPTKKRRNRSGEEYWAHAPYNFVPLPEKVVTVDSEIPKLDGYTGNTGYVDCALETRSPLYTRCAINPEFFRQWGDTPFHELPEDQKTELTRFFFLDDAEHPVIPGSSLRGMVRALVEIAGYGKMQWVTGEPMVFRAVGDTTSLGNYYRGRLMREGAHKRSTPLMQAGYLEKHGNRWFIRPAQTIDGTTFARIHRELIPSGKLERWCDCKNAYRLWVKLGTYDFRPVRGGFLHLKYMQVQDASLKETVGFREAVLAYSGKMTSKQREAVVFPPDPSAELREISDELIRAYRNQITQGQQQLLGPNGVLNPGQPVFYLLENAELAFFGHVMLFRLPYKQSPLDLVPKTLREIDSVDLSEAMFGFVPQVKQDHREAHAGRVFFTDARPEPLQTNFWLSQVTPEILSGPKPTTFQHYLTQQEPDEVESGKRDKKGNPKMELRLDHYASPTPHKTTIRGHKLYWHQGPIDLQDIQEKHTVDWATDTQHTRIKPVKAGVRFRFRIYFENLRNFELGALLWALALPGEEDNDYCHSIGMGKPLGMGAVKITPTLYLSNRENRYMHLFVGDDWERGDEMESNSQEFVLAFEEFVLKAMDARERGAAKSLKEVQRIRMLLKMLEWPGPEDHSLTEYMVIEPSNEYKERPVLPNPLNIDEPSGESQMSRTPESQRAKSTRVHSSGADKPSKSQSRDISVGSIFTSKVYEVHQDGTVLVEVRGRPTTEVYARIAASDLGGKQFGVGQPARCQVVNILQEHGHTVFQCKPGPKQEKKKATDDIAS